MAKKILTSEQYLAKGGGVCPLCGSNNISAATIDPDGKVAISQVRCSDCDAYWHDEWILKGYFDLYDENDKAIVTDDAVPAQNPLDRMKELLKSLNEKKAEIAKIRDVMRDEIAEFEELAEDLDNADIDFGDGIRSIEDGIDGISKTL